MKTFLKQMGATLVALLLFFTIAISTLLFSIKQYIPEKQRTTYTKNNYNILYIKATGQLTYQKEPNWSRNLSFPNLSYALENAAKDPKIKGLFIEIAPDFSLKGYAYLESIAYLIKKFKKSGKPMAVYSQKYNLSKLATFSLADIISVNPAGTVSLQGPSVQLLYYKKFFDKFNIDPSVYKSGKNKNALESFTDYKPSKETKIRLQKLLSNLYQTCIQYIINNKNITKQTIEKINNNFPILTPPEAISHKLITTIGHQDETLQVLNNLIQEKSNLTSKQPEAKQKNTYNNNIDLVAYNQQQEKKHKKPTPKNASIVIIPLEGMIMQGESNTNTIGSAYLIKTIQQYANSSTCKAIIFTIDTPGGDAIAAEAISHAIEKTQQNNIKIVFLMGNYSTSAGLLITASSDYILAYKSTVTGCIGVTGARLNLAKSLDYLGIHVETIKTTPYSNFQDQLHELCEKEKNCVQNQINYFNQLFRNRLIKGRKIKPEIFKQIGHGESFLATKAKKFNLIDKLTERGIEEAIEKAADLANVSPEDYAYHEHPISIRQYIISHLQ